MSRPRIFIGIPCYGMVAPEVLEDWMRWTFHLGRRLTDYDFFIGIRIKSEQFRARNVIVEAAQEVNADWLLMLDDDMIVNPLGKIQVADEYGFVEKLLAHDKDIVGALYYQRTGGCAPVAMMRQGKGYRFLRDNEVEGRLQAVDVAGGGALLVRMAIFDKLPRPFFAPEHEFGTDVQLCRAAQDAGYGVFLDSSIELGHVRDERVVISSRNRHQYAMESALPGDVKAGLSMHDIFNRLMEDGLDYTGYTTFDRLAVAGQQFMTKASMQEFSPEGIHSDARLADWYRQFPMQRVARQVWFNTAHQPKRVMTEFILGMINDGVKADILDFGCGIGVTAFELALRGHNVTAVDIEGTGTIDFLRWRSGKHKVPIKFQTTPGGVPDLGPASYGAIIVMDCLEHIPNWRAALHELTSHLKVGGMLFCNNGILDDTTHPEHFPLSNKDFYAECIACNLVPYNQIAFMKREAKEVAA